MRTIEEKLSIIESLKARVFEFLNQKDKIEYIDLCEVLEELQNLKALNFR